MIKVPVQYINNLDDKYEKISNEIEETISDFNDAIIRFIREHYSNKKDVKNKKPKEDITKNPVNNISKEAEKSKEEVEVKIEEKVIHKKDEVGSGVANTDKKVEKTKKKKENIVNDISGDNSGNEKKVGEKAVKEDIKEKNESKEDIKEKNESKEDIKEKNDSKETVKNEMEDKTDEVSEDSKTSPKKREEKTPKGSVDNSNKDKSNKKKNHNTTVDLYTLPKLSFSTKNKYIRKFYKKLIVRLHPDKIEYEDRELFSSYYEECKAAVEIKSLYKLWLLSHKIGITIKVNRDIEEVLIKEINVLKKYVEDLEKSEIYNWKEERVEKYIFLYIKNKMRAI